MHKDSFDIHAVKLLSMGTFLYSHSLLEAENCSYFVPNDFLAHVPEHNYTVVVLVFHPKYNGHH